MSSGSDGESPMRPSEALPWRPIFCLLRGSGIGFCATSALSKGRTTSASGKPLRPEAALPKKPKHFQACAPSCFAPRRNGVGFHTCFNDLLALFVACGRANNHNS